jgi:uncharacterized protein YndB with AHSA1/START domain
MSNSQANFEVSYTFNAPREMVFNAFGNQEALNAWWGPAETENSVISLDFRPGGIFHFKMQAGKFVNYGRFIFGEIRPYDLIEFNNAFADENAQVVDVPFDMDFPREIFYRVTFTEQNGKTTIQLTGSPLAATDAQTATFKDMKEDMEGGFGRTFEKLVNYLNS